MHQAPGLLGGEVIVLHCPVDLAFIGEKIHRIHFCAPVVQFTPFAAFVNPSGEGHIQFEGFQRGHFKLVLSGHKAQAPAVVEGPQVVDGGEGSLGARRHRVVWVVHLDQADAGASRVLFPEGRNLAFCQFSHKLMPPIGS